MSSRVSSSHPVLSSRMALKHTDVLVPYMLRKPSAGSLSRVMSQCACWLHTSQHHSQTWDPVVTV